MFAKRPQASAKRPQASAKRPQSVRKRPRRVGHAGESTESKIVAKRRTAVTFYVSHYKGVNSHRDRGGRGRVKCQHGGGVVVAKCRTVVTFGLASRLHVSKVSTVTGIGGVVVAKPRTVVTFGLASSLRVSKVSTITGIGGVLVAKPRTVVTLFVSSRLNSVNSHRDPGGSWSRNAELSSLLDSPRAFASQKCQQSQRGGRGR